MDSDVRLVCPASCFTRYKYFYNHLNKYLPRLYKIVEKGELTTYITNGDRRLAELKEQCAHFEDRVIVSLFGDTDGACKDDLIVDKDEASGICERTTTLTEYLNDAYCHCHIAVCVFVTEKKYLEYIHRISNGTEDHGENIILLNKESKRSYLLKDIDMKRPLPVPANSASSQPICKRIETVLESRIVECMDTVATFVHKFVPSEKQHFEKKLLSRLRGRFYPFMRNVNVITDLSPDHGMQIGMDNNPVDPGTLTEDEKTQIFHRKLTDYSTKKIKTILCEQLAVRNGLPVSIAHELLSDDGFDLEKKISEKNKTVAIDPWPSEYGPEGAVYVCRKYGFDFTEALKDTIEEIETWTKKQMKYFDLMMKMEFELHGILEQTKVPFRTTIPLISKLPYELQIALFDIDNVESCGHKYGRLVIRTSEDLLPADISRINNLLQKHQYPFGYTFQTDVTLKEQVRKAKPLISHGDPVRAQTKETTWVMASIGCFFRLKQNHGKQKKNHAKTTKKRKPTKDETVTEHVAVIGPIQTTQHQTPEQTASIVATEHPTIGGQSSQCMGKPNKLYAITCAHFVRDCDSKIHLDRELSGNPEKFEHIGHVVEQYTLYEPHFLDMALLEVLDEKSEICNLKAVKDCGIKQVDKWKVRGDKTVARMPVYMIGATSNFQEGTIIESDTMTRKISDLNKSLQKSCEEGNDETQFDPLYTMLIEPRAEDSSDENERQASDGKPFSKEGDSGSVIWFMDANGKVFAVALLCGDVCEKKPVSGEIHYSYASNINQLFKVFESTFSCTLRPACARDQSSTDSDGETQHSLEGAVGGLNLQQSLEGAVGGLSLSSSPPSSQ